MRSLRSHPHKACAPGFENSLVRPRTVHLQHECGIVKPPGVELLEVEFQLLPRNLRSNHACCITTGGQVRREAKPIICGLEDRLDKRRLDGGFGQFLDITWNELHGDLPGVGTERGSY